MKIYGIKLRNVTVHSLNITRNQIGKVTIKMTDTIDPQPISRHACYSHHTLHLLDITKRSSWRRDGLIKIAPMESEAEACHVACVSSCQACVDVSFVGMIAQGVNCVGCLMSCNFFVLIRDFYPFIIEKKFMIFNQIYSIRY